MTHWLLAAEADKIQDFLFRSSRLAQVAGGSAFLARFCREAPSQCGVPEDDQIVHAGGSFRLRFGAAREAQAAGRQLADAYRRAADGSLTVAAPVEYQQGGYEAAVAQAEANLRLAKRDRRSASALAHFPYVALCASCGCALAEEHGRRFTDERENYLCLSCRTKSDERKLAWQSPDKEHFLNEFLKRLKEQDCAVPATLAEEKWGDSRRQLARDAADIASFDPKNYVAYVVADGNAMGALFGKCRKESATSALSEALNNAMWAAMAGASAKLHRSYWQERPEKRIPALPLIVGGDDLFALIAAPYALNFGKQLCVLFEEEMKNALQELDMGDHAPSLSAALVICKASYPYMLAHRHGERLLARAKRLAKSVEPSRSVLDFQVVLGADWGDAAAPSWNLGRENVVPTCKPYWAASGDPRAALSVESLLTQRAELAGLSGEDSGDQQSKAPLPGKRRAELRGLFLKVEDDFELLPNWKAGLESLLKRISRNPSVFARVNEALKELGDSTEAPQAPWRQIEREGEARLAHGLPDLLEAWDFAHSLDTPIDYEPEVNR